MSGLRNKFSAVCLLAASGLFSAAADQRPSVPRPADGASLRILFVGNSYFFENNLPAMFAALAQAGGHSVETAMVAAGGWTLAKHAASKDTLDRLAGSRWDYVILQEQSQIASVERVRQAVMYPVVRLLVDYIRFNKATPVLFLTWAHRDGWRKFGLQDADAMQTELDRGYLTIAREVGVAVIPAGPAWTVARQQRPPIALWQFDGSHPNPSGTYLSACVLYATLFIQSPQGLPAPRAVPPAAVPKLQAIAATVVLSHLEQWNRSRLRSPPTASLPEAAAEGARRPSGR